MLSDSKEGEEKEEVTMDTSENRPENEVPEPPMPIADQVSNDDCPEGSAEEEEKKESSMPKSFKRKISVVSATKGVQAGNSDTEGGQPGRKNKAAPCIYWLPLTESQIVQEAEQAERAKEREKRRKEREEEEQKEREKEAERERNRQLEREKRRKHSRERERDRERKRDRGDRDRGRERDRRDTKHHSRSQSRSTPVRDRGGRR